ncbi:hypothetical protein B0H15DRAFT_289162 [Mycena belliarum]|uniref:Uncharacterized protein n=1 Tax=Mycena belliarum TaxID=1033014 RepID=A0AAD6U894_9AGAR|nr:hypothetical protein B0H15DRAFT_289162 [Mycena belliae]
MALRKFSGDEWTANGVKSTLIIDMPAEPQASRGDVSTNAVVCGWGWQFFSVIGCESGSASPILLDADSSIIPWQKVTLYFDPNVIRGADFERITFRTHLENLLPIQTYYAELSLPYNGNIALAAYMYRNDASGPAKIAISVGFPSTLGMALPAQLDARVEEALAATIRGEEVVDIKFWAYTRRIHGDAVTRPRAMYAKMALLRGHSDDLDAYLNGISGGAGFSESVRVDLDGDMCEEDEFGKYDYMSDSDLDSDDEEDRSRPPSVRGSNAEDRSRPPSVRGSNALVFQGPKPAVDICHGKEKKLDSPAVIESRRTGYVVTVKGHAYQTWNALIYYLYTKKIAFRSLGSRPAPVSRVPECSAKSMYRLADAYGLNDLKSLARASLQSQLSRENIVAETFSSFTSVYPEIQDIEVDFLIRRFPDLEEEIENVLKSVCEGSRPHCFDVLRKIVARK